MLKKCTNKILDDQKQNSKETWKILNTIINKRQNESSYPDSFISGGIAVSNKNDIADGFNMLYELLLYRGIMYHSEETSAASKHSV